MNSKVNMRSFIKSAVFMAVLLFCATANAQTYCTPTVTNLAGYGCGMSNTTIGSINNTTGSPGSGSMPVYFNYTSLSTAHNPGATVSVSVTLGTGNGTKVGIYIDWNNDGTFGTSGSEYVWSNTTTTAGSTQTGSFVVPSTGVAAGIYRMRVVGDISFATTNPCALQYSGEIEDYSFVVTASSGIDAAAVTLTSPTSFGIGNNTIALRFANLASTAITSASVGYNVNGGTPVTQSYSGSLASGAFTTTTFSTPLNLTAGTYTLKVWVTNPNSVSPDSTPSNDTITRTVTVCNPLSGTYTIDAAGSGATNFTTFTSAISALVCGGVSGPVTFNVASGTYVEQVIISAIAGVSATNTVTINGGTGNAAACILSYNFPATPTNYAVLNLDGADYVRVKNITITSTSSTYGYGVLFSNQADYNIIDSCIIDLSSVTNTAAANSAGINFNTSTSTSTTGNHGNYNIIRNNTIKGGASGGPYRGINVYSASSGFTSNTDNQFTNNTITDFYSDGIYIFYSVNNMVIRGNTISRPNRTSSSTIYGIHIENNVQNMLVDGNKISNPFGGQTTSGSTFYGIYFASNYSTGNKIINNAIYNINGNGVDYGMYLYNNYNYSIGYYNNTISLDFATAKTTSSADYGIYVYFLNSGGVHDFKNNIITVRRDGTGAAPRYGMYFQDYFANNATSNYNLILANGASTTNNIVRYNGIDYASLSAWKSSNSSAFDQNSVSIDPLYANVVSDVTPTSCGINNLGVTVSGVTTDITGANRGATPDLGAYEFNVSSVANNGAITGFGAATATICSGGVNAIVVLKNEGTANLTSAKIDWKVNGTSQTQYVWSGTLASGSSTNVTIGTANFNLNSTNTISAYLSEVNGTTDGCMYNDTSSLSGSSGMSGSYTINPSGSGSTNFTTFELAVAALTSRGVCGAVTFDVAAATYTVASTLNIGAIPGASSVNTITFDGGTGNAATRIIQYAPTCCTNTSVVRFDNTQWIRFRNLTVQSTGTSWPWVFHIYNNSSNIQIRNCVITNTAALTSQTSTNYTGVVISNSYSSLSSNSNSVNIDIDSNTFNGLWYGMYVYGNTTAGTNTGINIRKNTFSNTGFQAVYLYYTTATNISNNTISMRVGSGASTTSSGIYLDVCLSNTSDRMIINKNYITGTAQYGIYLNSSGGSSTTLRCQMFNNAISGGFSNAAATGIYLTSATYWDIFHNSVNVDNAATGTAGAIQFVTGAANFCDVRNNNFAVTNASASGALCFRSPASGTTTTLNYNNYFKQGAISSTTIINVLGTNYTPSNFATLSAGGANSLNNSPSFTSSTNLLPTVGTNNGVQILSVSTDIQDSIRNNPPDVGAYEIPSTATIDLGIVSLVTPDTTLPLGTYNVAVKLKNFASTAITGFTLKHTVNGGNMQDTVITGINLAQYDTLTVYMGSANQATFGISANTFKIYIENINSGSDNNQINDTLTIGPRYPALNGTFTINPSGSGSTNFLTFTDAVAAVNSGGVSGPVTFNVASTTFNEQVSIGSVSGASSTNTINFVGNGSANTILNFDGNAAPNSYTVRLNGSQWVNIQNMTLRGGGVTSNWVLHLLSASNNTIRNCKIEIIGTGATSTSTNYAAVLINGSNSSYSTSTSSSTNNYIDTCTIVAGYQGVGTFISCGTCKNYFRNNTVTSPYYYGYYVSNAQAVDIKNSVISLRAGNVSSYGMYLVNANATSPTYSSITANSIVNAGQYGIAMASSNGSSGSTYGELMNNMIGGGFTNNSAQGIYSTSSNWKIYHNTVNMDFASTSSMYAYSQQGGATNDVRNNIFAITNASATQAIPVYITTSSNVSTFDFNDLYNVGSSNLATIAGSGFTTSNYKSAAYPSATGLNAANRNPVFTSSSNLHIGEACMNGTNLGVTTDFDGNTRGGIPDIGADEISSIASLDASAIKINAPSFPYTTGSQPINATLQNNGSSAITALTISYSVNGGTPVSQNWTGSLAPCDTLNFTFTTNYNFGSGPNVLKVYTSAPNSGTDANTANDTVTSSSFCSGMSGVYTINPSGSGSTNYTSFGAAISALQCGGVSGPVVFNVAAGVYDEQISIPGISGTSATNTITFQSASLVATSVTLSNMPSTNNWVLNFNGADYVTFKRISITNANTGCCTNNVIQFSGQSDYNTIRECVVSNLNSTNGNLIYENNTTDNYNRIVGNTFNNGSAGVFFNGNSSVYSRNNIIDSNTFNNQYNYGIYTYYQDTLFIRYNTTTTSSATTYYGIQSWYSTRVSTFAYNRINTTGGTSTTYGIYFGQIGTNATNNGNCIVANNFILAGNGAAAAYGIYEASTVNYTDIVHNTVSLVNTTGSGAAFYVSTTMTGCRIGNNIFVSASSSASAYALQTSSTSWINTTDTLNYNNYYSAGTNLINWGGTNYTAAQFASYAYHAVSLKDYSSQNKQVIFTTSLYHTSSCLAGAGTNAYISSVAADIDGASRNSTAPCIGATEYTALAYDLNITAVTAPASYSASPQTVSFTVRNNGTTTITSFTAGYHVNYGTSTSQTFSSLSLGACATTTLSFTTQVTLPAGVSTLRTFNSGSLNGSNADGSQANDTSYRQYNGGMSGVYTINAGLPPSNTNFQTFTSAITAVSTSPGVSGPVTFNVAAGTYSEQLIIPAIPGSSTTNTVTFDGGSAASVIVTCAGISTNYSVFRLSNTANVTLKNMTIRNTGGSFAWGVHIYTTTTGSNLKVKNCIIKNSASASVAGGGNFAGIVASGSLTSSTTSTSVAMSTIELDSNTVDSAYYGIIVYSSTLYSSGVTIRKNTITNIYFYPVYAYYLYGGNISNNSITLSTATSTTSSYGIYMNTCNTTGSVPTYVNANNIYGAGTYGIYMTSCAGSATAQCQLYNNMVRGGFRVTGAIGIYLSTVSYYNVYHNSSNMDFATTGVTNCPIYQTGGTASTCNIKNNNFAYTASTGTGYGAYLSTTNTIDYNNYYKNGAISSTVVAYYGGSGNLTQASLSGGSQNANSVSTNPNFTSSTDLHVTDGCLLGTNLGVTTDFDGDSRSSTPTIGADEYTRLNNDIGISALLYPSAPAGPGTQQIIATLKNYGLNTVTSATVKYSVNGSTPVSVSWTGTLASCATATVTFTGANQYTFAGGTNVVKVWTELPNTTTDARASNDTNTTTLQLCNGLSGTYTIDPAGSGPTNYVSFNAAKTDLLMCGVSGAVTFTVAAGTYTEQLLLSAISGVSSTNTITFDGGTGNSASRIITYAPTLSTAAYTIRLDGSQYVRFKNLTIRSTGSTYANAMHIMGASHYAQVKNCIIEITGTGATSTGSNYVPLLINNTNDVVTPSTGSQVNFIEIDSNTINSGYYNIYIYGLTSSPYSNSNKIRYNTLNSAYQYGIYFYFQDGIRIQNNTIAMRTTGSASSYGLYCSQYIASGSNYVEISSNKITDAGGYGMYLVNFNANSSYRNKIYNNMIGGGFRSTNCYGISIQSAQYNDIWNNTINIDYAGGSAGTACLYSSSTLAIDIRNNIFVVSAGSGSTVPVYIATTSDLLNFDYNNFANASGSNLVYLGGTNLTASTYQGNQGFNTSSQNASISFTSNTNLHQSNACLNGTNLSYITTDIDGQTRGTTPDMGADEVTGGVSNDLGVYSISSPGTSFTPGMQDVKVVIRNYGTNAITSATVSYSVNGGTAVSKSWTGSLNSCDSTTVTFTGGQQYNFLANTSYSIVATVSSPNGGTDNNSANNSLTRSGLLSGMSGAYTINPSGSGTTNYTSFTNAVNALASRGVTGAVTFTVSAATYTEQVTVSSIPGISSTNTVVFDGGTGNAATRILTYSSVGSGGSNDHTLKIDNIQYLEFRNLYIRNTYTGNYPIAVQIYGSCHYTKIRNCILEVPASTSTLGYFPLLINGGINSSSPSVSSYVYGLEIDSNTIKNGYYGIYMYGVTTTPYSNNNKFRYNTITNADLYSAYFYYQDALNFSNDSIYNKGSNASSMGLYMQNCISTGSNYHVINSNKIYNAYAYGVNMTSSVSASSSFRNQFVNNMVGGLVSTTPYGVYFSSSTNFDIFFNTINVNTAVTSATGNGAFYITGGTGLDIRNNIFSHTSASATASPFYCATNPMSGVLLSASSFNYNNFYQASSTNRAYINGTNYSTTTLVGALGYNTNSLVSANPTYVSATTNLHVSNSTMNGVAISGYTTDIDGATRVSPPDMGADEIPNSATALDASIDSIVSPALVNNTIGVTTITVRLKNVGTTTLTGANINYSVNGATAVTQAWTGSLVQNATATITFTTTYTTAYGTAYALRVWSSAPNAGTDGFVNNDTLYQTMTPKLNGTYTVNASGSGSTNFTTFTACSTALGFNGVSGPVTINVAPATYTGQIVLPAASGASASNTITVDGGSASTTILTNATTTSTATYTLRLNGASYYHIRNFTIRATNATYGWPVHIMNSNNVKIRNCAINFVGATTPLPTGNTNFHGVVVNNSTSSYSTAYAATNIDIDSNSIRGGYSGIYVAGSSSTGINIRNNTLDSCDTYGIYISSGNGLIANNNTLNMYTVTAATYGIYLNSCNTSGTYYNQVNGNFIKNAGAAGIYITSSNNQTLYKGQVYNNMITEGFRSAGNGGIYSNSSAYWNIYYNTVNYDLTSGYALFVSNSGQDVRNNMLVCSATSGSAYPFYTNSTSYINQLDYNNYYNAFTASPIVVNFAGTTYTSANFVGAQGFNGNSKSLAPGFAGTKNPHLTNPCFNGATPISGLTTDIDGNTRSGTSPDIGADEVVAANNNIGVDAIVNPTSPLITGTQNVVVRIKNFGGNTVTSANVSYKVNGGSAVTLAWTGSLAPCDTISVYFTGANQYNFASGGSYTVQAYTDGPNGSTDANTGNDTVSTSALCGGMSGTFTINPAGSGSSNYTTFAAAIAALQCSGVNGPVTFNVSAGTYSEQVVIPAITGASATNSITFDGGSAAGTIVDFSASSSTAAHTIRIDNASYITLRNLTIHGSGSTYANSLHIYGTCNYVKVKNCVIDIVGAGTVSTSTNFACVVINGSTSVTSSTAGRSSNMEIDSNTIQYGYYGIFSYSGTSSPYTTNNKFRKNTIDSSYVYGIYAQNYIDTIYVNNNTVNLRITGSTSAAGIYLSSIGGFGSATYYCEISGNKVINPGQYGIYAAISNTSSSVRSKVNNNMIGGGFRNTACYGFYASSFYNVDFFYNTIVNDAITTAEQNGPVYFTGCLSLDIRNNILVVSNASSVGLPFYSAAGVTYTAFNYNEFYKAGTVTNLFYSQGSYQTPASFVGGGGYNINSINRPVAFLGSTNLHSTDAACFNGQNISSVTTDFDGQTRGSTPDMGADENAAYSNDVAVDAIVTPVAPLTSGLQDVKIRIRNAGSNTITAATVNYKVNGGSAVTINWTGTLVPCDTTTITFTGANQYNFAAGGTYAVQAYTSGANSTTDPNASNDTINGSSLCTGFSGTYTINPSGSGSTNFTSFGAAITAITCGGVTGPLTFNVASGTYNEQVIIPALTGTSASNTVTFQSATGNVADVTLTYNSTVSTSNYVVRLNGADYVNLKKMTLTATNTSFGHVIEIQNTSTFDTISNCVLNGIATTSASTNFAVVFSTGTRDNGTVIYNNTINYGYYGVYWAGASSAPYITSASISNNTFNGQGSGGIYVQYHSKEVISSNIINLHNGTTTSFYGIQQNNSFNGSRILKNKISGNTTVATTIYGIYSVNATATSTDSALIANNVIAISGPSGTNYGLFVQNNQWYKVYHNSVNITGGATSVSAAYLYSSSSTYSNNTAWNNIFVNRCTGASANAIYFYNTGVANYFTTNYNNLWSSGTNLGSNNGTLYTTLATWYGSSGTPDVNSTNKLPGFTSATDLHHTTPCINNTGYIGANSFVTDDYDGNARSATTPDAGAYEFSGTAYDAAAGNITAPTGWSGSAQTVTFRVINRGSTTITSLDAGYNVNGGSVTSQTFTGLNIAACDSATLSFTTQVTLSAGQSVLRVFTKGNINSGNSDALLSNDTAQGTICNALSGTYTINPSLAASGTNFQSFATAIAALSSCGVSGAVTVNVAAGTYNEQVTIPYFTGGSATNTVSFEGADSSTTIISYNTAVSASRYVVKFNGARYTSFRNFKVISPNTTQAWGIQVAGAAATDTSNRIARCTVVIPTINNTNFAGIVATTSTTSPTTTGNYAQALTIDSCTVSGGYYGIVLTGFSTTAGSQSDRNIVRGCNIINASTYGLYAYCQSQFTATGNTITGVGVLNSVTSAYGMYFNYCDSFTATKNIITAQLGGNAIYSSNSNGGSGQHHLIANNMIQIGTSTNSAYGINLQSGSYHDVVYNSVNITSTATANSTGALYHWTASGSQILNNNFVNLNTGYVFYCLSFSTTYFTTIDNNNYYGAGTNPINGSYANAAAMANAVYTNSDINSKSVNPNFVSSTNLHTPSAAALNAAALPYSGVSDDIDGNSRNGSTPDIGCDEFNPPSDDMGVIAITKPVPPVVAGASDVWVVIKNYASTTLTSATVKYVYNSTTYSQSWSGSLATNATDTVKFTATSGAGATSQQSTFASGSNSMIAYSEAPNGNTDGILSNDTFSYSFCTGLSGTYTINPSGSGSTNYTTITAAISALQCGGVSGPVVFNIASGTYTGQYIIPSIAGAGSTNTITFQSATGVASAVTLQNNSTVSTSNYIVRLYAADYIKFSRVTFSALNSAFGQCIEMTANGSDYATNNTVQYCVLNANSTGASCSGIYSTNSTQPANLTVYGNTFYNGGYGVYVYGSGLGASSVTGLLVDSNFFGTNVTNCPNTASVYTYYTTAPQITRNTMYSRSTSTIGCYIYYGSGNVNISRNNFLFSLGGTAVDMEYTNSNGETSGGSIVNNSISLGGTSTARGLYLYYCALTDVVFNSIYSTSTLANSASNVGIYTYGAGTATYKNVSIMNNNVYSTSSYALYVDGNSAANATGVIDTCNYNNFYSAGTNLAYVSPSAYTSANFASFKGTIYSGSDANSISGNPGFTSASNLMPNTSSANAWIGSNMGTPIAWINNDINGNTRSTSVTTGAPDLGAYVYGVPSATPSTLTTTGTHATSGTEDFYFNGKKVASITWGSSGTIPTITPRFYPGAWADTAGVGIAGAKFGNAYWGITASGGSGYTYDITLYYDPAQLGTVGSESDIRMAKRSGPGIYWTAYIGSTSTVNTTTKALTTPGLSSFSEFIITDQNNPLPVTWLNFNGQKAGKEVLLTWSTASEINNSRFDVERSINGKDFVKIGEVAGHGTTLSVSNYSFIDPSAAAQGVNVLYYRLRQVDYNNDAELSKVVVINMNDGKVIADAAQLYPNPFTSTVAVTTIVTHEQPITITVVDQFGRLILSKHVNVAEGINTLTLDESALWAKGVYFISIKGTQLNKTEKVIRY